MIFKIVYLFEYESGYYFFFGKSCNSLDVVFTDIGDTSRASGSVPKPSKQGSDWAIPKTKVGKRFAGYPKPNNRINWHREAASTEFRCFNRQNILPSEWKEQARAICFEVQK